MQEILNARVEESDVIEELTDEQLQDVESGGICIFLTRCLTLSTAPPLCPKQYAR